MMAEGRRRRQRRRRWVIGTVAAATATAVVAVTVGPSLLAEPGEPDPAPPVPKLVRVEVLSLDGAVQLPTGVLRTHHAPGDNFEGVNWDRWAGVTDDGYVVRIRNVYETDTTTFGLVDPVTGRTEWLPEADYDFGDPEPLHLAADELVFLDNRRGSGAVAMYDRIAGAWSSYSTFNAFNGDERMYQLDPITRASVDVGDRLWIKLFEAPAVTDGECATDSADLDFTCQERWWSVPFREGGRAERIEAYDGRSLVWDGDTGVSVSAEGLTITTPTGEESAPLAAPEGCELRDSYPPIAYAASPPVIWVPCADGSGSVVVYDETGAPLSPCRRTGTRARSPATVRRRRQRRSRRRVFLIEPQSRRVYAVASGPHTVFTDIGGGLLAWQSPEEGGWRRTAATTGSPSFPDRADVSER